jgi:hypothetical protein
MTHTALERILRDDGQHPVDVIESFDEAERNYVRGTNHEARQWQELTWRAKRGEATAEDIALVVTELKARGSNRAPLLHILGETRATEHEALVAACLVDWTDFNDPYCAIQTLIRWGLLDKYEDTLIEFIRGTPHDRDHNWELSSWCIAFAATFVRRRRRPRVLRVMIDAATEVPVHHRVNALGHLARVVGYDEPTIRARLGLSVTAGELRDHPFAGEVLRQAEALRDELAEARAED